MPGFVKTPKDEARWARAKDAASKSKDKGESDFNDRDWALTNYIYHRMSKNQEDQAHADFIKSELKKQISESQKKPSIRELKAFLENRKHKK